MNRLLLQELQRQRAYPSVTLLQSTVPGSRMDDDDLAGLTHLADLADRRLDGDVPDEIRVPIVSTIMDLLGEAAQLPSTKGISICVSPHFSAVVRLGRDVRSRCIIDDTFATRDMVADLNRTAEFRVVTVSDRKARLLVGDRSRLVEDLTEAWPLLRDEEQSLGQWSREVSHALGREQQALSLPTVIAGVDRSVREILKLDRPITIGLISGNHDRTGWVDLHTAAWPLVTDWLRSDRQRARERLDHAHGARRYAGGIEEVWDLANDGRVELLVVEESYDFPARVSGGRLQAAKDRWAPDVVDDAVDELIEIVLQKGGSTVIVPDGDLIELDRVAAVLRY